MLKNETVGVVIPAYNEEGLVGEVLETVPPYVDRVYVVDDASTDDTWTEIERTVARIQGRDLSDNGDSPFHRRFVTRRHDENRGVGGAIKTGYLAALDDGVDVVAVMAGDGQMDPALLESFVEPVVDGRADYTKGNRFMSPATRRNVPPFRLFGNVLLSVLTKIASGYWTIGDSQNGYTAISREALESIAVEEMYEFYGYCNDLLVRLNAGGWVVADVPAPIIYDEETSHIDYRSYVPRVSLMLLSNFLWRLKEKYVVRNFNPLVLLYGIGVAGEIAAVWRALVGVATDSDSGHNGSAVQTALLGALMVLLGMLQDKRENEALGRHEPPPDADAEELDDKPEEPPRVG